MRTLRLILPLAAALAGIGSLAGCGGGKASVTPGTGGSLGQGGEGSGSGGSPAASGGGGGDLPDGGQGGEGAGGIGGHDMGGGTGGHAAGPDGGTGGAAVAFSRAELLAAFGTCAAAATKDFSARAAAFNAAAAALASSPTTETRRLAREAFQQTMDSWQIVELMQFGPTGRTTVLGGRDFRDNIYAWPLFSRCAIEEEIVTRGYESATFSTSLLANRRGLGTVEFLLFYEGADTACTTTSATYVPWMALSASDRDARRAAYAARAVRDVAERAVALAAAWAPEEGNFPQTLRTAGAGNATYPTTQAALSSVTDAVFYIESQVKDMKLEDPLGLDIMVCSSESCPGLLESRFARRSKANVAANLEGLQRLLEGCGPDHSGLGFDDLLTNLGAAALADTLRARVATARAAVAAVSDSDFDVALVTSKPSVRAVYDAVKGITDLLKTEFATILDIELPGDLGTDND